VEISMTVPPLKSMPHSRPPQGGLKGRSESARDPITARMEITAARRASRTNRKCVRTGRTLMRGQKFTIRVP
jgi:hypothetical protein